MIKIEKNKKRGWKKIGNQYTLLAFVSLFVICSQAVGAEELKGVVAPDATQVHRGDSFATDATVGEVVMLREEFKLLQSELIEVLEKYETLKERDESLDSNIVSKMMDIENLNSEEALSDSRSALDLVSEISRKQSAKTIEFCDFLDKKLNDIKMDELDKYELKTKLKSLRVETEKTVNFLNEGCQKNETNRCDILSVDDKLQVVILAVGANDGVKVGDNWYVNDDLALIVVSVRPYVAASMLLKGKIGDIAPGMKAYRKAITRTKK